MAKKIKAPSFLSINHHELLVFLRDEMPPKTNDIFFNYCQQTYWCDLFARFSYFFGRFDGDRKIFRQWDKHYLQRINAHVMLYSSLYNVIFCAWENDIVPIGTRSNPKFVEADPLDCLISIMFSDWELAWAKNNMKVQPTLTESYNLSLKIAPSNLYKIEKSKHPKNGFNKLIATLWERLPENYYQIKGVEELCFYAARDSKDPVVQDKFATYIKDYREYGAILKKIAKLSTIRISQTSTKLF
jgi:hypothetical protein